MFFNNIDDVMKETAERNTKNFAMDLTFQTRSKVQVGMMSRHSLLLPNAIAILPQPISNHQSSDWSVARINRTADAIAIAAASR